MDIRFPYLMVGISLVILRPIGILWELQILLVGLLRPSTPASTAVISDSFTTLKFQAPLPSAISSSCLAIAVWSFLLLRPPCVFAISSDVKWVIDLFAIAVIELRFLVNFLRYPQPALIILDDWALIAGEYFIPHGLKIQVSQMFRVQAKRYIVGMFHLKMPWRLAYLSARESNVGNSLKTDSFYPSNT